MSICLFDWPSHLFGFHAPQCFNRPTLHGFLGFGAAFCDDVVGRVGAQEFREVCCGQQKEDPDRTAFSATDPLDPNIDWLHLVGSGWCFQATLKNLGFSEALEVGRKSPESGSSPVVTHKTCYPFRTRNLDLVVLDHFGGPDCLYWRSIGWDQHGPTMYFRNLKNNCSFL